MDYSKLPKFSQTPAPPPAVDPSSSTAVTPSAAVASGFCTQCGAALPPGSRFCGTCGAPTARAANVRESKIEIYIGMAVGLIILLMFPTSIQYASHVAFGTSFAPYVDPVTNTPADYILMTDGTKIPYRQLLNFWSDMVLTLFGASLVLGGILFIASRKPVVRLMAFALVAIGTAANIIYLVTSFSNGIATFSLLAAVFGAYWCFAYWSGYEAARDQAPRAT